MTDCGDVISVWTNISLQISSNHLTSGKLQMIQFGLSIVFHWIPHIKISKDVFDVDPGHLSAAIELHQVESIVIDKSQINYGIIDIIFKDFSTFPRLIFHDHGSLAVSHLAEYLVSQNLGYFLPNNDKTIILITSTSSPIQNLPEFSINSTRFNTFVLHWNVLDQLGYHNDVFTRSPVSDVNIDVSNPAVRKMCFEQGISSSKRCLIWPKFLIKTKKDFSENAKKNMTRYQKKEFEAVASMICSKTEWIKKDKYYMKFLRETLQLYALFNPGVGYPDGLCDVLTVLMDVFIISFSEDKIEMADGRTLSNDEAISYMFKIFCGFIELNGHYKLFLNESKNYNSYLERIYAIIRTVDPKAAEKLDLYQLKDFIFICGSIYSLYARDFTTENTLRFWDAVISSEDGNNFPLFFNAATCIMLFNPMFMQSKKNTGEIVQAANEMKGKLDVKKIIFITQKLMEKVKGTKENEWIFMEMQEDKEYLSYKPKYVNICNE